MRRSDRHILHILSGLMMVSLLAGASFGCGDNITPRPERQPFEAKEPEPIGCVPNLDEQIEASELQPALGVPVSFLINPAGTSVAVDIAGATDQHGVRVWDWTEDRPQDQVLRVSASDPTDKWYGPSFPAGEFITAIDAGATLDGIYSSDEDAVYLHGVASSQENPPNGKTLIVYEDPVIVIKFPLEVGQEWTSVGRIREAQFQGVTYFQEGTHTYDVEVDGIGEIWLPDVRFTQVMRVRTSVELELAQVSTSRRQVQFMAECFGEVARATAEDGAGGENFTTAAEVRRIGFE